MIRDVMFHTPERVRLWTSGNYINDDLSQGPAVLEDQTSGLFANRTFRRSGTQGLKAALGNKRVDREPTCPTSRVGQGREQGSDT